MDLTQLGGLPGAAWRNFEALTRAIVARRYGALGALRARRQQPGVEFYLRVERSDGLGEPGRIWGWSCKWFILGANNELTTSQRREIEDSLDKAVRYVEGLTDFVLCLPQHPSAKDEEWIFGLGEARGVTVTLWTAEAFEAELAGFDELRSTFFGELVLTPDTLAVAHARSVHPIRLRWAPPLHTANHVERRLERTLLRPRSFDWLRERADAIASRVAVLGGALTDIEDDDLRALVGEVMADLDRFVGDLNEIVEAGRDLRPMEVCERLADVEPPSTSPRRLRGLVLELRKRRLPAAPAVSGLGAEVRDVVTWLDDARADVGAPLIAVVADAGLGKTHLAAQLTAPEGQPTAGVFIQGGKLRTGSTLDDLARRVPGLRVDRFDDLLAALNSAGLRAGVRVPLVIDGLNEAERPSEWHALLDELVPALGAYPNVQVIITLRQSLAGAVPEAATTIELEWDETEVSDIVDAYFEFYLINPAGAWLPTGMFSNPLFLRMFCEVANPLREGPVGVEALPTSLIGVFERYRQNAIERLAEDAAREHVPVDEITRRLSRFALELWRRGVRRLPTEEARAILDAGEQRWDESLFRRLVEEGMLLRDDAGGDDGEEAGVLFDRFAGYLIADGLLGPIAYADLGTRLSDEGLWESVIGDDDHRRPFGEDVGYALIGVVPRRFSGQHVWRFAPEAYARFALAQELDSESEFLDDGTVDELMALIAQWEPARYGRRHPFDRLWEVHSSSTHRLNSNFLDRVLRQEPLPERDRRWTEWIRRRAGELLLSDLKDLIEYWTSEMERAEPDDLHALAVAWLLTSTHREVRDLATKALQRFGRPEPRRLFDLATRMLDVDDPYVVERLVGAAFGAASAHQMPDPGGPFENALTGWLTVLRDFFLEGGSSPTAHELLRSYIRASFELGGTLHPEAVPEGVDPFALSFETVLPAPVMADDDPNAPECDRTFGMDFENYVIGSAIEGRGNYDFQHTGFRQARGEIMARVWDLGWRAQLFDDVDREIAEAGNRFGHAHANVERYGKKYGWIAYYELIGRLADDGRARNQWVGARRNVSPDVDPSFPDEPSATPFELPDWAPAGPIEEEEWLRTGGVNVPMTLWAPEEIHGVPGGWLLVEGFLEQRRDGRRVFGFVHTFLVAPADVGQALELIGDLEYPGNQHLPESLRVSDVFAGELPWSPRFEASIDADSDDSEPPALRRNWQDDGVEVGQLAVRLSPGEGGSPTALEQAYDVPAFNLAARFGLRQMPGTLDLVGLDGRRASATFRANEPWSGQLLFVRRDLVIDFAAERRILQVAWGERAVSVDWGAVPNWVQEVHDRHEQVWRETRVADEA